MDTLHWPLTVLSRAVHFKNLTGASAHVGLSQPQLSRLISQIEKEFDVVLLDRSSKRKSTWTPAAHRLAEVYMQSSRKLKSSMYEILKEQVPAHVNIGTLEGLLDSTLKLAQHLFEHTSIKEVEVDVYDQNDLEEKFYNGDLDLVLTSRSPGKQKFKHVLELGFQSLNLIEKSSEYSVLSAYEYGQLKKKPSNKILVSNSLSVRKIWLERYGGSGIVPSAIESGKCKDSLPVLIIASEGFNENIWRHIVSYSNESLSRFNN